METVATTLAEARRARNFSQQELAGRAGTGVATIARYEQGRGLPNRNTLRRIADVLGLDFELLAPQVKRARAAGSRPAGRVALWLPRPLVVRLKKAAAGKDLAVFLWALIDRDCSAPAEPIGHIGPTVSTDASLRRRARELKAAGGGGAKRRKTAGAARRR